VLCAQLDSLEAQLLVKDQELSQLVQKHALMTIEMAEVEAAMSVLQSGRATSNDPVAVS
jgi:sRNA-binding regulator protein Hfq